MQKLNDLSRSLTALQPDGTLIAVIEMSLSSRLVAGIVPGVERQPLKKARGRRERIAEAAASMARRS
jgi:transposase